VYYVIPEHAMSCISYSDIASYRPTILVKLNVKFSVSFIG